MSRHTVKRYGQRFDKKGYTTQEAALYEMEKIRATDQKPMATYVCVDCGFWHFGRQPLGFSLRTRKRLERPIVLFGDNVAMLLRRGYLTTKKKNKVGGGF